MPLPDPNIAFYDDLAGTYHRMYEDWWGFAVQYTEPLVKLLEAEGVKPPAEILDCTCGIGTQALPLAVKGYRVTGSDLSERAVERARSEARSRGLNARFVASDVRQVDGKVDRKFDAVITGANSITHLITDEDLMQALKSIHRCLRPGGVFLATIRDYDEIVRDDVQGLVPEIFGERGHRSMIIQAWEWAKDRRTLTTNHILMIEKENDQGWDTTVRTTDYRALLRSEFDTALTSCGFTDIRWFFPEETGHYQPAVVARAGS